MGQHLPFTWSHPVGILLFLLLVTLVTTFGPRDTLAAIVGAVGRMIRSPPNPEDPAMSRLPDDMTAARPGSKK